MTDETTEIEDLSDDEDETEDMKSRWELDPETMKFAREMRQLAQQALKNLVNTCTTSVDGRVVEASSVYQTTKAVVSKLAGVEGKGKGAKLP